MSRDPGASGVVREPMLHPPAASFALAGMAALDEERRQRAVDRVDVRRIRVDAELARIVRRAANCYGVPIAGVTIISGERQLVIVQNGSGLLEVTRDQSFCAEAIKRPGESMVVDDAAADPRFASAALVKGPPFIRFYAGVPIVDRGGYALGALCIADTALQPGRPDLTALMMMAHEVERRICH